MIPVLELHRLFRGHPDMWTAGEMTHADDARLHSPINAPVAWGRAEHWLRRGAEGAAAYWCGYATAAETLAVRAARS